MSGWPLAVKNIYAFCEGLLYKNLHEREIKQNLANKQAAKEIFAVAEIQETVKALADAVKPKADAA
eukprot:8633366-Alexandrium_andersonii.AAC.1